MTQSTNSHQHEARLKAMREANYPQGVVVDPMPITAGEEITVLYYGTLAKNGTEPITLRVGYGEAGDWHHVEDMEMARTGWGWVKKLKVNDDSRLNICFKDKNDNWDNNNGMNWSYEIHNRQMSH